MPTNSVRARFRHFYTHCGYSAIVSAYAVSSEYDRRIPSAHIIRICNDIILKGRS